MVEVFEDTGVVQSSQGGIESSVADGSRRAWYSQRVAAVRQEPADGDDVARRLRRRHVLADRMRHDEGKTSSVRPAHPFDSLLVGAREDRRSEVRHVSPRRPVRCYVRTSKRAHQYAAIERAVANVRLAYQVLQFRTNTQFSARSLFGLSGRMHLICASFCLSLNEVCFK